MENLGSLTRVDPREIWKNEATEFTPWLEKNLSRLAEVLNLDLELTSRETSVGDFSVDLVARDLARDRVVIIENQLEPTDHRHLGQIITYAAGLDAAVVVWITVEFREEHRQALDWLNRVHEGHTEFFGLLLEVLRVDNSKPAVNFRPVAFPNKWSRDTAAHSESLTPKRAAYQVFFQRLLDDLREQHKFTNARAAQPQNWYSFSTGMREFSWSFSFAHGGRARAELYIDSGDPDHNEDILDILQKEQPAIEKEFGEALQWERLDEKQGCRIACYTTARIEDSSDKLDDLRKWAIDRLLRFKHVFTSRLRRITSQSSSL